MHNISFLNCFNQQTNWKTEDELKLSTYIDVKGDYGEKQQVVKRCS